jgi:uncharacterized membrane protein YhaH (DUF805 family)
MSENTINNLLDTRNPLSLKGRFSRSSFLAWSFLSYLPFIIMTLLLMNRSGGDFINTTSAFAQFYASVEIYLQGEGQGENIIVLIFILLPILFIVHTVFLIRRLHDINLSAWFALLVWLPIPTIIGIFYFALLNGMDDVMFFVLVRIVVFVSFSFTLFVVAKKGVEGANKFGSVRESLRWEKVLAMMVLLLIVILVFVSFSSSYHPF